MSSSLFKHAVTVARFRSIDYWARLHRKTFHYILHIIMAMKPGTSGAGSVSRMALVIDVLGKGSIPCEIARHLAPTTSRSILNALPVQGRVHRYGNQFAYFETGLVIGAEKQRTLFKRGDIGLLVSNGSICVFLNDSVSQPMNPLGRVTGSMDLIDSSAPGDVLILRNPTA